MFSKTKPHTRKSKQSFTKVTYKPDFRQAIAKTWPESIDDSLSCKEWNCNTKYNLSKLTDTMLNGIKEKFNN